MTKSEKSSLLLVGLAGALIFMLQRSRKAVPQLAGDAWGGGIAGGNKIPDVIIDFFGGRSVSEVLANPGPIFQREVLDYRQEGRNYPAPFVDQGQYL